MPNAARDITIPVGGTGQMPAVAAYPAAVPAPAIVIVPSVFGIGQVARDTVEMFAAAGYLTITLDMFFRTAPGPLDMRDKDAFAKAVDRAQRFDHEQGQRDIERVRDYVLALPECNGKWACVGYCFGGRYTLLAGAYMGADAVAAFHPSRMGAELEAAAALRVPASFHCGGADQQVPPSEIEAVQRALAADPRAELYVYPGVAHGFTSPGGPAYDEAATRLSLERTLTMLEQLKTPAGV
jgi:carboxymethylenebutenolidase